jgi:hypothetical protein
MFDKAEFEIFKEEMASDEAKSWTECGQQMRDLNIGVHWLGSEGYRGKLPVWEAEDAKLEHLGNQTRGKKSRTCSRGTLFGPATI